MKNFDYNKEKEKELSLFDNVETVEGLYKILKGNFKPDTNDQILFENPRINKPYRRTVKTWRSKNFDLTLEYELITEWKHLRSSILDYAADEKERSENIISIKFICRDELSREDTIIAEFDNKGNRITK